MASEIRVNSLGFPGLVPDEEVDISLNPAYLGLIEGQKIFCGVNYDNQKAKKDGPATVYDSDNDETSNCKKNSLYGEYVKKVSNKLIFGIKLFNYNLDSSYHDITANSSTESNDRYVKGQAAWLLSPKLSFGSSFTRGSINTFNHYTFNRFHEGMYIYNNTIQRENADKVSNLKEIGLLYMPTEKGKIGLTLVNETIDENSSALDFITGFEDYTRNNYRKDNTVGIRLLPEFQVAEKITLRSHLFLLYKWNRIWEITIDEKAMPLKTYTYKNTTLSDTIGMSLIYNYKPYSTIVISLYGDGVLFNKIKGEPITTTNSSTLMNRKDIWQHVKMRLGLEQQFFAEKLVLRGSLDFFDYFYYYTEWGTGDFSETKSIYGPVSSYQVGVGYRLKKNLLLDFTFFQSFNNTDSFLSNWVHSARSYTLNTALSYSF